MADIYIAQTAQGSDSGENAANAHSALWFNTSSNWASPKQSGKIGPGDTVHFCGILTQTMTVSESGSAGNPITLLFESGSSISPTNSNCIYASGRSYITIDGNGVGVLENTANGTLLAYQTVTSGIYASSISNFTVKNLTVRNLYVHTSVSDSALDFTSAGGFYSNGYGQNTVVENCTFSHVCWCLTLFGSNGGTLTVDGCTFENYDHGIGGVASSSGTVGQVTITNNHFGSTANWDTTANRYHHDGIHTYWGTGGGIHGAVVTGNLFDGDWGVNNTAHIFCEQNYSSGDPSEATDWTIANNVHVQYAGNYLNNGFMVSVGNGTLVANNTYVGASVSNQAAVYIHGDSLVFKNNVISGANRFLEVKGTPTTLDYNVYAAASSGGNSLFRYNLTNYATFALWKTATGGDANSSQISSAGLNSSGVPQTGSYVIGSGQDLSAYFTTDFNGELRQIPWDAGAISFPGPRAPTGLTAVASSDSTISLSWIDDSTNESGFIVERQQIPSWVELSRTTLNRYNDSGLLGSTRYYYRVRAYNSYGESSNVSANAITNVPPVLGSGNTFNPSSVLV